MCTATLGESVLWFEYYSNKYRIIKKLANNETLETIEVSASSFDVAAFIAGLSAVVLINAICIDGAMPNLNDVATAFHDKYPAATVIVCTSFQSLPVSSHQYALYPNFQYVTDSWSRAEYEEARGTGIFGNIPDKVFEERFYYAGGNVRLFMLGSRYACNFLLTKLDQIRDPLPLLDNSLGLSDDQMVNSLILLRGGSKALVSQYVIDSLSMKANMKLVAVARGIYPNNNQYQGWVYQLEVETLVQLAHNSENKEFV